MAKVTASRVRRWTPTPDQEAYLRKIAPTRRFLHNLPDDVRERFAGQWIAAQNEKILAAAPTLAELFANLADPGDPTVLVLRLETGVTIRWRRC